VGTSLYELRKKIDNMRLELDMLDTVYDIPELITSTNLLRSNEHLVKIATKQSELLTAYAQYSEALQDMIAEIFGIQNDLKNILKEQSKLIMDTKSSEVRHDIKRKSVTTKRKSVTTKRKSVTTKRKSLKK
jgi:hypothetical protein